MRSPDASAASNTSAASSGSADVSILIPAYMAASFIDRTLYFARGQTHAAVSIVVSVDAADDNTPDIVRAHAAADSRIVLHVQEQRLGWAGNLNFLLEQVATPYFFIYFHDDILLPQYCERMLETLRAHPQAAGAYCDMGHFGATDHVSTGPAYLGSTVERLLTLMLAPHRGSPLRAMLRSGNAGHVRLPQIGSGGFWANEPFLMEMLAAGPLQHVPQVLYLRWNRRSGSLTDGWRKLAPHAIAAGWRSNIEARLQTISRVTQATAERQALVFALFLQVFPAVRELRDDHGVLLFPTPASLHPLFARPGTPQLLDHYSRHIGDWADARFKLCGM
jgi:glycosyltransferase involved in cell wall biosynthesis